MRSAIKVRNLKTTTKKLTSLKSMPSRQKILVTGSTGMLGRELCGLLSLKQDVVGVSRSGRDGSIACELSQEAEISAVFRKHQPDLVINTAAYSDVDGCERDPKRAHESNALAVKYLASLCGRVAVPLVHISTDYVFDGYDQKTPYTETAPTGPRCVYGLTKLEGEYYAARCKSASVVVRTSWLFGPGNPANFVNVMTERLKTQESVSVLADQVDAPTSVTDLSLALQKIATHLLSPKAKKAGYKIYHVCNGGSTTRYEMALKIRQILKRDIVRVQKTDPASIQGRLAVRPAYAVLSNRRFEKAFRMKFRPWQESLKEYLLK